ncbi:hypothetical protein [Actinomycetospora aeridis]|uniref:Uncharacterized protein n=1 Tax=Actinomycetospora aeridis TaxID=3129231 RepID=A0ABU8N2G3_9PSEU
MSLASLVYRKTVTVHPYEGEGAGGPVYGTPFDLACWYEPKRADSTDKDSETTAGPILAPLAAADTVPVGSLVDVDDTQTWVKSVARFDSAGLVTALDHVEITVA